MKNHDTETYHSIIDSNLSDEDPVRESAKELVEFDPDLTFSEIGLILTEWIEQKLGTWFTDDEG